MELYEYDNAVREKFSIVCGVDEAGRGPLAGDVFAAAVIFDDDVIMMELMIAKAICKNVKSFIMRLKEIKSVLYCCNASIQEIEEINILNAAKLL